MPSQERQHVDTGSNQKSAGFFSGEGAASRRRYQEGPVESCGDVHLRQRYYTCETDAGLIAGKDFNVMFTVDQPAKDVWRCLKDFNLWQNAYGYFYSGVVGELEGQTVYLTAKKDGQVLGPYPYHILRAIPEYLIVAFQPVPEDGTTGGISPGFHVMMLNEHDGKTTSTFLMEHGARTQGKTEEEALAPSRQQAPESHRFWRDIFIPALKKLAEASNG
jgi:hypothetical protein